MPKSGRTGPKRAAAAPRRPIIPNEIFLEIFSYIQPSVEIESIEYTSILSQLSLVCNFFCTTLRPRLFRQLVLDERTNSRSKAFCQALISGDAHARALAVHIHNCRILHLPHEDPNPGAAATASTTMHHQALCWAPNIEYLHLARSGIGDGLWRIIGRCSKLKTLSILFPTMASQSDDVPAEEIGRVAELQLSTLRLSKKLRLPPILNTTALTELSCDPDSLLTLLASGPINTLETLSLSEYEHGSVSMWSLIKILSKVPSVRDFTIWSDIIDGPEAAPRDFTALVPNLRSLTCGFPLAVLLARDRPLVSLYILGEDSPPLDLGTVLGSHGPYITITYLAIPSVISLAAGHFPHLRELDVGFPPDIGQLGTSGPEAIAKLTKYVLETCAKWPVHPSVQRLCINVDEFPLDLPLQHAVLTGSLLSQKFPALRSFRLGNFIGWERFAVDEAWRVFIPVACRKSIVASFDAGDPEVVDYGGYLQQLSEYHREL